MSDKQKPTKKNVSVKFTDFYERLESVVKYSTPKAVNEAFNLLKKGFSDEANRERVDNTLKLLSEWSAIDMLAVKLTTEKYSENLKSSFVIQISNQLRMNFRSNLEYPKPINSKSVSLEEAIGWLNQPVKLKDSANLQNKNKGNDIENMSKSYSTDNILRMKFVCLFGELSDDELCKTIYALLENHAKNTIKNFNSTRSSYIESVGTLLTTKLSASTIKNLLIGSSVLKSDVSDLQHNEHILRQNLRNSEDQVRSLKTQKSDLEKQLQNANAEVGNLKSDAVENKQKLKEWEERYEALEEHWQRTLKQDLITQSAKIKKRVQDELTDIKLSIEGDFPDIEMAIDLIKDLEKIVGDVK
ncbi:MAG: hypothetical protein H0U27_04245 [Nitrosopumilus sp.]|nr:hypothetical protein [Nitrosopumilus sp.]